MRDSLLKLKAKLDANVLALEERQVALQAKGAALKAKQLTAHPAERQVEMRHRARKVKNPNRFTLKDLLPDEEWHRVMNDPTKKWWQKMFYPGKGVDY